MYMTYISHRHSADPKVADTIHTNTHTHTYSIYTHIHIVCMYVHSAHIYIVPTV